MERIQQNRRIDVWEKWEWVWHLASYGFIALNVFLAENGGTGIRLPAVFFGLTAGLALWYVPYIAVPAFRWQVTPTRGLMYLLPGWLLWGGLLVLDPTAFILMGMFFLLVFTRFPVRWSIMLSAVQSVYLFSLYLLFYKPENWLLFFLIVIGLVVIASLIGIFISALIRQSQERKDLIEELSRTRANLLRVEREAGVMAERQRLAREIHDTLTQDFTSIIMHLSAARLNNPSADIDSLQLAERTARDGLDEARRIVWALQPQSLENGSLAESLESLASRWSVDNGIPVKLQFTGDPVDLDRDREAALLRISQEALNNIKKHAGAHNVNLTLTYMSDLVALDITDDGQGFDPTQETQGFGLKSMSERAEQFGGTLSIESGVDHGTALGVSLPSPEVG